MPTKKTTEKATDRSPEIIRRQGLSDLRCDFCNKKKTGEALPQASPSGRVSSLHATTSPTRAAGASASYSTPHQKSTFICFPKYTNKVLIHYACFFLRFV